MNIDIINDFVNNEIVYTEKNKSWVKKELEMLNIKSI